MDYMYLKSKRRLAQFGKNAKGTASSIRYFNDQGNKSNCENFIITQIINLLE